MKITPLEIRQKNFEKKLRGYDKDEVSAFLLSLSNEWERVLDENKEYRIKLEQAEKEVKKLREVESSLFKTLKTAEDTGASLVEQANKAAELHLKETQMNAEAMLGEAKSKAKNLIEKAESEARDIIDEMQEAVKDLEENYRTLENLRSTIISELKNFTGDVTERIDRTVNKKAEFKLEDHTKKVKEIVRESEKRINKENLEIKPKVMKPISEEEVRKKSLPAASEKIVKPKQPVKSNQGGSFFDELED
ncbi:DivIVA domain-containing protein [Marinoscillum sp. MHG1-6]|uniref:DivIVA domain-containing protein n=1 Tax=Marinoscillum sp. MHG1-6 TaxID=2959627 RepID=UPI0021575EE8|nr:DivIVA domain-containing protein [Marinoscillum sp. MHG1-6]